MHDWIDIVFGGLQLLFQAVLFVLVVSAVLSWLIFFNVINTRNPAVWQLIRLLERITAPILAPFRMFIPSVGGIDLSFLVAFLLIQYGILGFLLPIAERNMRLLFGG